MHKLEGLIREKEYFQDVKEIWVVGHCGNIYGTLVPSSIWSYKSWVDKWKQASPFIQMDSQAAQAWTCPCLLSSWRPASCLFQNSLWISSWQVRLQLLIIMLLLFGICMVYLYIYGIIKHGWSIIYCMSNSCGLWHNIIDPCLYALYLRLSCLFCFPLLWRVFHVYWKLWIKAWFVLIYSYICNYSILSVYELK